MTSNTKRQISAWLGGGVAGAVLAILVGTGGSGLIPTEEGRRNGAYLDPVGIPTICEGWTHGVRLGDWASDAQCDELTLRGIRDAAAVFVAHVPGEVRAAMPTASIAAFLSFIYNVGLGQAGSKDGFVWLKSGRHSTMLRLLQAGDVRAACMQMPRWATAQGKPLRGLRLRRQREMALCLQDLEDAPADVAPDAPLPPPQPSPARGGGSEAARRAHYHGQPVALPRRAVWL